MASEQEIERLVVRLLGDGSSYQKMLVDAQSQTKAAAAQVESASRRIEGFSSKLTGFASVAVGALAALGGKAWLGSALKNFQDAELTALKLGAALEANGRDVAAVTKDYTKFAESMEKLTTAEDDAVLAMLQTAESMGITGEAAKRAVKNSIALAAAKGGEAASYVRLTTALEQGNSEMLGRMLPALRGITDDGLRAAKAQELLGKMFGTATAEASSSAGAMKMLSRDYGNLLEDLGAVVAEVIKPVVQGLREAVAWFRALSPEIKTATTLIVGATVAAAALAATAIAGAAIFNMMTGGVLIMVGAVVTAGAALAVWVNRLGGVGKAWEVVKTAGTTAWGFIQSRAAAFMAWIQPSLDKVKAIAVGLWERVKSMAGSAWDWIQERVDTFVAWVKPAWDSVSRFAIKAFDAIVAGLGKFYDYALSVWETIGPAAGEAFDYVTTKVGEFVAWVRPIWQAVVSFLGSAWEKVSEGAVIAWGFIKDTAKTVWDWIVKTAANVSNFIVDAWRHISDGASIDWGRVRDFIRDAFIAGEFAVKNFSAVWDLATSRAALGMVKFGNVVEHFFTGTLPAMLSWFSTNWKAAIEDGMKYTTQVFGNLANNIVKLMTEIPGIIAGTVKFSDIWGKMTEGMDAIEFKAPKLVLPDRQVGDIERELQREYDAVKKTINQSFEEFKRLKLDEFAKEGILSPKVLEALKVPEAVKAELAKGGPGPAIEQQAKATQAAVKHMDATLRGSAESVTRWQDYVDMLRGGGGDGAKASGAVGAAPQADVARQAAATRQAAGAVAALGGGALAGLGAAAAGQPETKAEPVPVRAVAGGDVGGADLAIQTAILTVQREILEELRRQGKNPAIEVEAADLA